MVCRYVPLCPDVCCNNGGTAAHTKEEALQGRCGFNCGTVLVFKSSVYEFLWHCNAVQCAFCHSKEPCVVYSECHDQADIFLELMGTYGDMKHAKRLTLRCAVREARRDIFLLLVMICEAKAGARTLASCLMDAWALGWHSESLCPNVPQSSLQAEMYAHMSITGPESSLVSKSLVYLGVSKNNGTPKWMVYNGKPY